MCHFLPVHHLGMANLAGSKVKIQHSENTSESVNTYESAVLWLKELCKDLYQCDFENKKVGDIVLIKIMLKTRSYWHLGRVLSLNIGDDGNVRSVNLKKGDGSNHTYSIKHFYPMELSLTHNGPTRNAEVDSSATSDVEDFNRRRNKRSRTKKEAKEPK